MGELLEALRQAGRDRCTELLVTSCPEASYNLPTDIQVNIHMQFISMLEWRRWACQTNCEASLRLWQRHDADGFAR